MAFIDGQINITEDELAVCLASPADGHLMVVNADASISAVPGALGDHTWTLHSGLAPSFPIQLIPNTATHGYFAQQGEDAAATVALFNGLFDQSPELDALEAIFRATT